MAEQHSDRADQQISINLPPDAGMPTGFLPIDTPALNLDEIGAADHPRPSADNSAAAAVEAPEKKLTLFALRLAILEKAASGIGALGFIWATVVLLGGFAISLQRKDFWYVTVILLVEGARIFSRSHELKWQHQATWTLAEAGAVSFRALRSSSRRAARGFRFLFACAARSPAVVQMAVASPVTRNDRMCLYCPEFHYPPSGEFGKDAITAGTVKGTWRLPEDSLRPNGGWVFFSRSISQLLYWLQLVSATACVVLSLMRLAQQDYGEVGDDKTVKRNRRPALNIFYGLALSEALLFLAERTYWEWKVSHRRLLEEVNGECGLGPTGMVSVRRFFYDAYSRCIVGSIFDGMKMDMVGFAEELLGSGSRDEQLMGTRILLRFATNRRFAEPAVRKIGSSPPAMDRLVEMLNWKSPAEEEIRMAAALVVSKLAGKKESALRVTAIPGAMESISSLLYTGGSGIDCMPKEEVVDSYMHSTFSLLGLLILKKLANEHDNCGKIGNTAGLLHKIINFTTAAGQKLNRRCRSPNIDPDIQAVKRALQVIKLLAGTAGRTGELLRREISEIVFTVGNIREILQHAGEAATPLRKLGLEILTSLAMEVEAREMIGATGGVLREMMRIFFDAGGPGGSGGEEWEAVRVEAGEALAMLAVESEENCGRILRAGEDVVERFVGMVGDSAVRISACRVLRNICAYGAMDIGRRRGVVQAFSTVFNTIMLIGEIKHLEVFVGLATQVVSFMSPNEFAEELQRDNISGIQVIGRLVDILEKYNYPSTKSPRIRRYVIELSIWMMQSNEHHIEVFKDYRMEKVLKNVADTTTELECFIVFSGYIGLTRYKTSLTSLVDTGLELLSKI